MNPANRSRIDAIINRCVNDFKPLAERIPGVLCIHELPDFILRYMSPLGMELLGTTWEEIDGITSEEYHRRYFNPDYARDNVPKILDLLDRNTDETVSYFQQVRTSRSREWDWYMTMTKILARDDDNKPLVAITIAMRIDPEDYFTTKASRLLDENTFLRNNYEAFAKLGHREKQVLRLLALGKSAPEIANDLHISVATAETHRKNIKRKLNTTNVYELSQYAHAFNLI